MIVIRISLDNLAILQCQLSYEPHVCCQGLKKENNRRQVSSPQGPVPTSDRGSRGPKITVSYSIPQAEALIENPLEWMDKITFSKLLPSSWHRCQTCSGAEHIPHAAFAEDHAAAIVDQTQHDRNKLCLRQVKEKHLTKSKHQDFVRKLQTEAPRPTSSEAQSAASQRGLLLRPGGKSLGFVFSSRLSHSLTF